MNKKEVELFAKTYAQIEAFHDEIASLSKKSPTDAVNIFKLKLINKILETANSILKNKYLPFEDFELFNEADLPNNSDVAMILSQYLTCMEALRVLHITRYNDAWWWLIDGKRSDIRTLPLKKQKG